jgi:small subunit ribosomal protein S20
VANTSSAIKRIRSSARKRQHNTLVRSTVRTSVKKAQRSIEEREAESAEAVRQAISELDHAVSKGVLHKNNASRRKARLAKKLNQMTERK